MKIQAFVGGFVAILLAGVNISWALNGSENMMYGCSVSSSTLTCSGTSSGSVAALAKNNPAPVVTNIATAGAGTLTAAGILGGVINRSGPTTSYTDTIDTAANIIAALPSGTPTSAGYYTFVKNTTAFAETLAAGTGITLNGLTVIPPNSTGVLLVQYVSSTAVTVTGIFTGQIATSSGALPASTLFQGGGSTGTFAPDGAINSQFSSTGVSPAATGADKVVASYTLPASFFDQAGRGLKIRARGSFGATGNNKDIKIIFNPASATVGSTVGAGGTTIADTGTVTQNGGGWSIEGTVFKYGAAASNTQLGTNGPMQPGTPVAPTLITATESGAIFVAITANATTATTDIVFNQLVINAQD